MPEAPIQRIKLLVVDDMPEAREGVRILLSLERDIEVVGVASNGREAIELAKELKPHIVLMDINMPVMDGISAAEIIHKEMPQVQIVMSSVQEEREYLRRAMQAGAREYIIKPFNNVDLTDTIKRVYQQALQTGAFSLGKAPIIPVAVEAPKAPPKGKIIAIYSPRGGTGKTMLTVNLALAFREIPEKKIALVDASLQFGDLYISLNLQPKRTIFDLAEVVNDMDQEILQQSLVAHSSGLQLLAAPMKPEMAELIAPESLIEIVTRLSEMFDFILVDTAPFLDPQTKAVLDLADFILLIVTPEICTLRGAKLFCELENVRAYPPQKIGVVFNKADDSGKSRLADVQRTLPYPLLGQIVSDGEAVVNSANSGIPILASDNNRPIARDIYNLARRLLKALGEGEKPAEKPAAKPSQPVAQPVAVPVAEVQPAKPVIQPPEPAAPRQRAGCSLLGGMLALLGLALVLMCTL